MATQLKTLEQSIQHSPRLVTSHEGRQHVHGTGPIGRFNTWIAVRLTNAVGTMWCAYVFALLALIGFPGASATPTQYVQWLSQTFIQLVMLSVIMVGQNVLQSAADQRAEADHETLLALKSINERQLQILERLSELEAKPRG